MTIAYVPNDPGVPGAPLNIAPSPDRKPPRIGFAVKALAKEAVYAPDTREYVGWAAREAALRAVAAFEDCAGPLKGWQGKPTLKQLALIPDAGTDLNAYYNRASISFFETTVAGKLVLSGASQDVVAHETGHAILDSLRPDLWDAAIMEVSAFHEGFGDCIALLAALADKDTRVAVLKADAKLAKPNFVEATAEALSAAIGTVYGATNNAAQPRHALNDYRWNFPTSLPDDGPPGTLINEMHSLGQLLSGCYYRIIQGVFARTPGGEAGLWQATKVATWLLAGAVSRAPVKSRFFQSVGRTMLVVDQAAYKGVNGPAIRAAYAHHGIDIGATTFLAPQVPLGPTAKGFAAAGDKPIGAAGARGVAAMLDAPAGAKIGYRRVEFGARAVAVASYARAVALDDLDPRLAHAVAVAPHEAFVGESPEGGAAMLGAVDASAGLAMEVRSFVQTLLRRDDIAFGDAPTKSAGFVASKGAKTHALVTTKGGDATLARIAFACGCRSHKR